MFQDFQSVLSSGDIAAIVSSTVGQIIIWAISIILLGAIVIISGRNKSSSFKVKELSYSGIAIAIGTVLSFTKIISLPQGGTVTLCSMLFVVLIGYWFGTAQGVICGFAYGLIQLALGGWVMHPIQLLLDYPLAFAALGFAGLFRNRKKGLLIGFLFGVFGRFVFHVISGVVFFAEYAGEMNPILYSTIYNGSFLGLEALITGVIILIPPFETAMKVVKNNALKA